MITKKHKSHRKSKYKYGFLKKLKWSCKTKNGLSFKHHCLLIASILIWLGAWTVYQLAYPLEPYISIQQNLGLTENLKINFDRPFNRLMIEPTIEPYASGSWESTNPIPGTSLYRSLEFKPAASFLPDQNYKIRLSNVLPAIGLNYNSQEVIIPFKTTDLPKIISASTDSEEPLPACQDLEFGFDQGILNIKKASLRLEPNADLDLQLSQNKKTLIAKPTDCLKQGQSYSIKISTSVPIDDQADPKLVAKKYQPFTYEKKFLTKPAPATSLKAPLGTARVDIKVISLEFSEPMQKEPLLDLIDIQPNLKGNWEWQDDQTLKFNLDQNLRYGEKYEVTVNGRAYSINGSFVEGLSLTFNTFGVAAINSFYPSNNQSQVPINQSIKINFNQEVDKEKAQAAFNINPPAEGSFNWQGTSMIFYPQFLQQDTFYTVNLSAGIGSINGLPSNRSYQTSFRTVESQTILNVPYDHQDYPLSCEASALKMALGYYGLNPSEDEIMGFIGHNGPLNRDEAANIWGNPNLGYVGDVNGSQNSTGYGVHWGPIAKAANNYRPAQAFSGWSASQLASEIEAGHPVVIWGSIGGNPDSWNDESGNQVYAWKGEHTWTVTGFTGKASNPTGFYTHNPLGGSNQKWTTGAFLANWSKFGYSGVVVK